MRRSGGTYAWFHIHAAVGTHFGSALMVAVPSTTMRRVCEDVTHFGDTDSTAYVHYMLDDVPIMTIEEALQAILGTV